MSESDPKPGAEPEIRFLGDLQRLVVHPGDVLVLNCDQVLSDEVATRLKSALLAAVGQDVRVIILGQGMRLGVVGIDLAAEEKA